MKAQGMGMVRTVLLVVSYCLAMAREEVEPVIQLGTWHTHTENLLLFHIGLEIHVPHLNLKSDFLLSLINMSD